MEPHCCDHCRAAGRLAGSRTITVMSERWRHQGERRHENEGPEGCVKGRVGKGGSKRGEVVERMSPRGGPIEPGGGMPGGGMPGGIIGGKPGG